MRRRLLSEQLRPAVCGGVRPLPGRGPLAQEGAPGIDVVPPAPLLPGAPDGDGETYYAEACPKGWEGLIAKRADSPYVGTRSRDWLKFKCVLEQEFVIGGYTDPQGNRAGYFGALLVGYYEDGHLSYAGKVGTGFDRRTLADLTKRLSALEQDESPFRRGQLPKRGVHWVRPKLVAEVGFSEWTEDGQLRHPRFLGLRIDKSAEEVIRERPQS